MGTARFIEDFLFFHNIPVHTYVAVMITKENNFSILPLLFNCCNSLRTYYTYGSTYREKRLSVE